MRKLLASCFLLTVAAAWPAEAYYHFVHYLSTGNAPEKFDLIALPGNTITFLVSGNGPTIYSNADSFNSVLGQIRQAAAVWNGVASSSLRVAFGGLGNGATPQNIPGGDVVFEDLPPGVEGFAGPTSQVTPVTAANGSRFLPIVRSSIHLSRDLTQAPGPSYNQRFFLTTLHEMGHALGLQHTFTSATMSQDTTRATTVTRPLDNDDVAGISVLYPASGFTQQFGSIAGRITTNGQSVHRASVVAIQAGTGAVSGVTNPDGSFRIDGIPAGSWSVYVHSLPPDADVQGPWNADGSTATVSGPVNSVFYPATTDFTRATAVSVFAGATATVNIATTSRADVPYYGGQVYGYITDPTGATVAVRPGPLAISGAPSAVAGSIVGLGNGGTAPGLSVQIPGGALSLAPNSLTANGILPYLSSNGYTYLYLYLTSGALAQPGPQHLIFTTPNYMYVLPSAIYLTAAPPPQVTSAIANADGTATITGTNLVAGSQIYFDALPAAVSTVDPVAGIATVTPPAGMSGQQSALTVYNPDGQNSQLWQTTPVPYSYGSLPSPAIFAISPSSLPVGTNAVVDISGIGLAASQGNTVVGFGSSDILVQRVFVISPDHIRVGISIAAKAALASTDITVVSGFRLVTATAAFQIAAAVNGLPVPVPTLVNSLPGLTGAYPGAVVSLYGANLSLPNSNTATITLGGRAAQIYFWSPGQINFQVPAGLSAGPATLLLNNGRLAAYPIDVNIDATPAGFSAVQSAATGDYILSAIPAHQGDSLIATMNNFAPAGSVIATSRVQVSLGGVIHPAIQVTPVGSSWQITFQIGAKDPVGAAQTLIVYLDGRSSLPATIPVAHPDGTFLP